MLDMPFSGLPVIGAEDTTRGAEPVTTSRRCGVAASSSTLPFRSTVNISSVPLRLYDTLHLLETTILIHRSLKSDRLVESGHLGCAIGGTLSTGAARWRAVHIKNAGE